MIRLQYFYNIFMTNSNGQCDIYKIPTRYFLIYSPLSFLLKITTQHLTSTFPNPSRLTSLPIFSSQFISHLQNPKTHSKKKKKIQKKWLGFVLLFSIILYSLFPNISNTKKFKTIFSFSFSLFILFSLFDSNPKIPKTFNNGYHDDDQHQHRRRGPSPRHGTADREQFEQHAEGGSAGHAVDSVELRQPALEYHELDRRRRFVEERGGPVRSG